MQSTFAVYGLISWLKTRGKLGQKHATLLYSCGGHFINLEKALFPLVSVKGWACSYKSFAGLVWVSQDPKKFDPPYTSIRTRKGSSLYRIQQKQMPSVGYMVHSFQFSFFPIHRRHLLLLNVCWNLAFWNSEHWSEQWKTSSHHFVVWTNSALPTFLSLKKRKLPVTDTDDVTATDPEDRIPYISSSLFVRAWLHNINVNVSLHQMSVEIPCCFFKQVIVFFCRNYPVDSH